MVAAERVADEDGIVARGAERAVGFIAQREAGEHLAALEGQRLGVTEVPRHDETDLAGREGTVGWLVFLGVGHTRGQMIAASGRETSTADVIMTGRGAPA